MYRACTINPKLKRKLSHLSLRSRCGRRCCCRCTQERYKYVPREIETWDGSTTTQPKHGLLERQDVGQIHTPLFSIHKNKQNTYIRARIKHKHLVHLSALTNINTRSMYVQGNTHTHTQLDDGTDPLQGYPRYCGCTQQSMMLTTNTCIYF